MELDDAQVDLQPMWKPDAKDRPKPHEMASDREGQPYGAELHSDAVRREQELHGETAGRSRLNGSPPHFLHELEGQRS